MKRFWACIFCVLLASTLVTAQHFCHVDYRWEVGVNFSPVSFPEGFNATTCIPDLDNRLQADEVPLRFFVRKHLGGKSNKFERPFRYGLRLQGAYNIERLDRVIDTNDFGKASMFWLQPGIEVQRHGKYHVLYAGVDLIASRYYSYIKEADEFEFFQREESCSAFIYGAQPFAGLKIYFFSSLSLSLEMGYHLLWREAHWIKDQDFNGSLVVMENQKSSSTAEYFQRLSTAVFSFHF